ncbi:MAG: UDP-glucose/GDP-mannose dehydrogenase family protein [Alphaproteobacteria bacterium]|jgi:GDP-mannose 6-dehydrogenase|nr:UDP-glucose/GDP-mannose dehydrogenase family protein [Alphaproteobacteria bacterium]MDP6566026.1 UDP-glucose/GDP-mannose dehydrogenase family protein [Alphaproteobacteria bacterium]MDP6812259.1 UDP-glucose/GDP-mannose dehydrogenase family protein [Alphaproteobacteria bacterium]
MRISIFGLGYVGAVSAACLAKNGHRVVGVDPNPTKVELINDGHTPVIEKDVGELIAAAVRDGALEAIGDGAKAVAETEMSLVCVGTPSRPNGSLDLQYVERVATEIGAAIAAKDDRHLVVIRSTILPGTMREVVIPALEAATGGEAGVDFGVCNNPEFLREGSAVYDFFNPPKTVIGESDETSGDLLASLYSDLDAPLIRTAIEVAEMVKYADNAWHGLKVGFGNEIGIICKALGIDSHRVMDIFCQDQKLNLSPYYLKPGFAFGGSCLPKDLRALTYRARALDLEVPILSSVLSSNRMHIERGLNLIMGQGNTNIGILGFSFKPGTDDLRESPIVEVIEGLIGKGHELRIYDRNVSLARLTGANRDYIVNRIPHISRLMVDSIDEVLAHGDTLVVGNGDAEFDGILDRLRDGQVLVDLARVSDSTSIPGRYDGICW